MKLKLLLSLSLLASAQAARPQSADEFFHAGAQSYLSNNIPGALERVESGLKVYPDDVKLKKLEELLKQQKQQQQSKQDEQQQKEQEQQQKQQQQSEEDKQKQEQQQQQPQNQDQQKQQEEPQQNQSQGQKEKEQSGDQEPPQNYAPGQMTPQQAQQLLDAQKGDEMLLPVKPEKKSARAEKKLRDW